MAALPPVSLGAIVSTALGIMFMLRKPLESRFISSDAAIARLWPQFIFDLALIMTAGIMVVVYLDHFHGLPFNSSLKMIMGLGGVGFFSALDLALAKVRRTITTAKTREANLLQPVRLVSMTRRFLFISIAAIVLVSIILTIVISNDMRWLVILSRNEKLFNQALRTVVYEIIFIMAVLLGMALNLIVSFSKNLSILFKSQTAVLERVSTGDLNSLVPVATNDEFGVIAGYTNMMILGLRQRFRLLSALKLAEELQQNLLPEKGLDFEGLNTAGTSLYCDRVGGDYYDYLPLPDGRLGIVVADASGHGIGAALYISSVRAMLRAHSARYERPAKLLAAVNTLLVADSAGTGRFTSLFFLEIDVKQRRLCWVRAGHEPAIYFDPRGGRFEELNGPGTALGVIPELSFQESWRNGWASGSVVLMHTDGVRETRNRQGEMFGLERLRAAVREHGHLPAESIQNIILEQLNQFRDGAPQEDDVTLVTIRLA